MDVPLKEHLESRLNAQQRELEGRFDSLQEAVELARKEMERRLGELNQLRKEVVDDREQLVRREVFEPAIKELSKQVYELNNQIITLTGSVAGNNEAISGLRSSLSWLARLVIGAVILALIAVGFRALVGR